MEFTLELMDCTRVLMDAIADKNATRDMVADAYWMAVRSSYPTDWGKVNRAIIARWSKSALVYIKTKAQK
jgi:hypothetical protein